MTHPNPFIDHYLAEQHQKWRGRVYNRFCRELELIPKSEYEWWNRHADQKRAPQDERVCHEMEHPDPKAL